MMIISSINYLIIWLGWYIKYKSFSLYMTPYNIYYFTYNRCLKHFFFSQEKETLHQRKSAARLGRLRLQGALAPANFILNLRFKMKKPCYFPVDFVYYRENRYFEFQLIYLSKNKVFSLNYYTKKQVFWWTSVGLR